MPAIPLSTFVAFLPSSGPSRGTKVCEARSLLLTAEPYNRVDRYLRRPLGRVLLAGGDPQPLVDCLQTPKDPKKRDGHRAIVDGLSRFLRASTFEAAPIAKASWISGDLGVPRIIEARTSKTFKPSRSTKRCRGLDAEPESFLMVWHGDLDAA